MEAIRGKLIGKKIYDFYIPSLNCIIETHGEQHYINKSFSEKGRNLLLEQENDKLKEQIKGYKFKFI